MIVEPSCAHRRRTSESAGVARSLPLGSMLGPSFLLTEGRLVLSLRWSFPQSDRSVPRPS